MHFFNRISFNDKKTLEELKQSIGAYAITHLTGVPSSIDPKAYYTSLASQIGFFLNTDLDPTNAKVMHNTWGDVTYNRAHAEKAYRYSDKHHPLHTDYSTFPVDPEMAFMFCEQPANFGGATLFLDAEVLIESLRGYDLELLELLQTHEVEMVRQGPEPTVKVARIIDYDVIGPVLNWNYFRVSKSNNSVVLEMVERFHSFLEQKIVLGGLAKAVKLTRGEAVFFHDCRVLHGRQSFIGDRSMKKATIVIDKIEQVKKALKLS
jgi:alpha-ketoglutarate-dependent taurine dioxygenase